jgi:hypothetical protein
MKGIRCASLLLPVLLLAACARAPTPAEHVVHEERALAKAHAAWAALYAERADEVFSPQNIQRFAPYTATLENGTWIVRGTPPTESRGAMPAARIRADDGATTVQRVDR